MNAQFDLATFLLPKCQKDHRLMLTMQLQYMLEILQLLISFQIKQFSLFPGDRMIGTTVESDQNHHSAKQMAFM